MAHKVRNLVLLTPSLIDVLQPTAIKKIFICLMCHYIKVLYNIDWIYYIYYIYSIYYIIYIVDLVMAHKVRNLVLLT